MTEREQSISLVNAFKPDQELKPGDSRYVDCAPDSITFEFFGIDSSFAHRTLLFGDVFDASDMLNCSYVFSGEGHLSDRPKHQTA
jgi:hypothetical protein